MKELCKPEWDKSISWVYFRIQQVYKISLSIFHALSFAEFVIQSLADKYIHELTHNLVSIVS